MDWIYIAGGLLVLAAVSAGLALGLHLIAPRWSPARRALTAAAVAVLAPMSLAFAGFFFGAELSDRGDFALGLLALVIVTLMLLAVIGLPPAWFATARLDRSKRGGDATGEEPLPQTIGTEPSA